MDDPQRVQSLGLCNMSLEGPSALYSSGGGGELSHAGESKNSRPVRGMVLLTTQAGETGCFLL